MFFRAAEDGIEVSRVIHGRHDMRNIQVAQREFFASPNSTEENDIELRKILPKPAIVAYNRRRADGPCDKTMLGDPAARREDRMNVQLPSDAMQFIEGLVASGEYESAEEAVADGVRLLMSRQRLRADIQKGIDELDTGLGVDGEEVFAELRARAKAAVEKAG